MQTKMPKYSEELERDVIGAMLLEKSCIPTVTPILRPECFYISKYREIFRSIVSLNSKNQLVDTITVCEELKRTGKLADVGGTHEVSITTNNVFSSSHAERHAMLIYQFFLIREMGGIGMKIFNLSNEPNADPFEIFEIAQRDLKNIDYIGKSNLKHIGDAISDVFKENKLAMERGSPAGIGTGYQNVDKFFAKQKQEFGVICARPGMGKTAFMLALAKHTGYVLNKPVAIFSLEMSTLKLVGRIMASESEVSSKSINQKNLTADQFVKLGDCIKLADAPIYFDDTANLDVISLRASIRRLIAQFGIEEVYIDYLQLMAGEKKGNREQEISFISRQIKMIAKEENIPIIALSQLSRKVDERPDKKPQLSDLRESGAIEQDADWVISLFRPEYYGIGNENSGLYEDETFDGKHLKAANLLVCEALKYREGPLFKAPLRFYGEIMRIENYDAKDKTNQLSALDSNDDFMNEQAPY